MSFALPLAPPDRIEEVFQLMEVEAEAVGSPSATAFLHQHFSYIRFLAYFRPFQE